MAGEREDQFACKEVGSVNSDHGLFTGDEEMMDDEVVDAAAHAVAASSSDDVVPLPAPPMMPALLDVPIGVADASVELPSGRIVFLPTTSVLKQVAPSG